MTLSSDWIVCSSTALIYSQQTKPSEFVYAFLFYKISVALQRRNPQRRKEKVYVGCGAGFGGDRPLAALKLLQRVKELDYLVLECLAERTLAERYQASKSGGKGYDPRSMFAMHMAC